MPTTDIQVSNLKINVLTEEQYEQIQNPSNTELYLVPEVVDTVPTEDSTNTITSGAVYDAVHNAKTIQTPVTDPTASGTGITFIDSIAQNANGEITPTKKTVQGASPSSSGVGGQAGLMSATDKEKLDSIAPGAEVNVQSDWNQSNSSADDYIKNKPTIPAAQVNSDWDALSGVAQILNKPSLATVATSGSYNDLTDKPIIPTTNTVTCTLTYNSDTHKYSCDKTVSELTTAYLAGKEIIIYADGSEFGLQITMTGNPCLVSNIGICFELFYAGYGWAIFFVSGSINDNNDIWDMELIFSADYNQLRNLPTLGTAAALDVAVSGNASSTQVVKGDDTRLTDSRPASDVSAWAKAATKPTYTASEVGAIPTTEKGAASGVAELDSTGKVPSSQLPSYVDDVLEYASLSAFPATGESGKIYIALDTNKTYRWGGSTYGEISESLALGETSSTAYAGNKGKANADAIAAIKDGTSIDSFGDVETALADKINKSSTAGLVKNDGTIDTNTYLTQHQDISGKANKSEMSVVDGTGSDADKTTITLKTGTSATVLKSHQDISGKQDVINSSNKLSADYIVDGTTNKVINVKPDWNAASGSDAEILNKPTIPSVPVTDVTVNGTSVVSNGTAVIPVEIPSQTGNSGKFLTTNGSAVSWANLPSDVVYCTWNGSTCSMTVKEIYEAYLDGKLVICKAYTNDIYSSTVLCTMTRIYWFDESSPGMGDDGGFVEFIGKYTEPTTEDEEEVIYRITAIKYETFGYTSWTWVGGDYINLENLQDAISKRHSHSNKTQLDKIPSSLGTAGQVLTVGSNSTITWANAPTELPTITGNANKILAVNSGATGVEWITNSGGGGLSNYDFTHVSNTTVSTSTTTITFAANQRGSQMITVSADIGITFDVRNLSDNYLWVKNTGSSEIDVTISNVVNNQTAVSNVYVPADGISVPAGGVCEIGVVRNADGAFITSRNDLKL